MAKELDLVLATRRLPLADNLPSVMDLIGARPSRLPSRGELPAVRCLLPAGSLEYVRMSYQMEADSWEKAFSAMMQCLKPRQQAVVRCCRRCSVLRRGYHWVCACASGDFKSTHFARNRHANEGGV